MRRMADAFLNKEQGWVVVRLIPGQGEEGMSSLEKEEGSAIKKDPRKLRQESWKSLQDVLGGDLTVNDNLLELSD